MDVIEEPSEAIFSMFSFSELRKDKEISQKGADMRRIGSFAAKAGSVDEQLTTSETRTHISENCPLWRGTLYDTVFTI